MRMEKEVYKAAINGDVSFLDEKEKSFLLQTQTTIKQNNTIHLAVQHGRFEFLKKALPSLPNLISQSNSAGDTPLHAAAKEGDMRIVRLLVEIGKSESQSPWKMKNFEGNTPLHLALIHAKLWAAQYLLNLDPDLASLLNNSQETPLHLAVRYTVKGKKELAIGAIQIINTHEVGLMYKGSPIADDSLSIIELLLQINRDAACLCDSDHLTPLHRAALKSDMAAIRSIVSECPESVEVFDSIGGTILHCFKSRSYEEAVELLEITEIQALKNVQDCDGNAPIHMAVKNCDVHMVRALLECSANLTLENKEGVCAAALIHHHQKDFLGTKSLLQVELDENHQHLVNTSGKMMSKELFGAADARDLDFLRQKLESNETECLVSRTNDRRNIIHVCCDDKRFINGNNLYPFIELALERLPVLICQIDSNGNTPLHLLLRNNFDIPNGFLERWRGWFEKANEDTATTKLYCPPWRVKNVCGNTLIHEALLKHRVGIAIQLVELDPDVARDVNNDGQTFLHLLCSVKYRHHFEDHVLNMIIEANELALDARDSEGLTPLLRTGRNGVVWTTTQKMLDQIPRIMTQCDNNRNTILHLMVHSTEFDTDTTRKLVKTLEPLWCIENNEGNTPPQLALKEGNLSFFKIFIEEAYFHHNVLMQCDHNRNTILHLMACSTDQFDIIVSKRLVRKLEPLWYRENNEGLTPPQLAISEGNYGFFKLFLEDKKGSRILDQEDKQGRKTKTMLGSAQHVPPEVRKILWEKVDVASEIFGYRSICGIPTTEINDYINTMSVTAALLATITFTAAFTVPGGFNSDNGTPILARKAIFCVFMVSDIAAMCFSMMVLFCLLWIMSGDPKEKVVLLDFSVFILQASFYATLVAFMAGVYVTVINAVRWLAILPLVACSLLVVLTHSRIIMGVVPIFFIFYQIYLQIWYLVGESIRCLRHKIYCVCFRPLIGKSGEEEYYSPKFFELGSWWDFLVLVGEHFRNLWRTISDPFIKMCSPAPVPTSIIDLYGL